ncbi:Uncharacterised protein [uncultured Flavonifractor sp.]|nr:Uncharacterised protein [Flavonifractor plautii]SCJ23574.1 Uncharacterised protein [uncultured Flavonifractor sp.]
MNEHLGCTCADTHWDGRATVPEYCSNNFIPTGWELEYESLSQETPGKAVLYLTGRCLHCGGRAAKIGVLIPGNLTGDALLERIYRQMEHYRPFDTGFQSGAYRSNLSMRASWYMAQDDLTLGEKNARFLTLFHKEDWAAVEEWIDRNRAEEPYTEPRRDRKSTLLHAALERARASGDLKEIEPILDYYLPSKEEPLNPEEDTYLTDYSFSAVPSMDFGCEGIYVDLSLVGCFDDSGKKRCSIGTFKTLRSDAEASRLMGQLCGVLMYHTTQHVNENLHRYTPARELYAEQLRKAARTSGDRPQSGETEEGGA